MAPPDEPEQSNQPTMEIQADHNIGIIMYRMPENSLHKICMGPANGWC